MSCATGPQSFLSPLEQVEARLQELGCRRQGRNWQCPAPSHEDRSPSLSVNEGDDGRALINCFGGCQPEEVCAALGLELRDLYPNARPCSPLPPPKAKASASPVGSRKPRKKPPTFSAEEARGVWEQARARSRDDRFLDDDAEVYRYLSGRHLADGWDMGLFGILGPGMTLPGRIQDWLRTGHRIVVPLFDHKGAIVSLQARTIHPNCEPKVLTPTGGRIKGTLFASEMGQQLLAGLWQGPTVCILGEGLTDFLAMAPRAPVPVLNVPGATVAASSVGPWVREMRVILTLHDDTAGDTAADQVEQAALDAGACSIERIVWPYGANDAANLLALQGSRSFTEFLDELCEV